MRYSVPGPVCAFLYAPGSRSCTPAPGVLIPKAPGSRSPPSEQDPPFTNSRSLWICSIRGHRCLFRPPIYRPGDKHAGAGGPGDSFLMESFLQLFWIRTLLFLGRQSPASHFGFFDSLFISPLESKSCFLFIWTLPERVFQSPKTILFIKDSSLLEK